MDEFSHTLLHNQNVFDEFKKIQQKKKEEEEKKAAADQAASQMANMNVYQPPQPFMQKFNDPSFFNHEYEKYKAHLASSNESDETAASVQTPTALPRGVSDISDDRNQEDISSLPQATGVDASASVSSASRDSVNDGQYANVTGNVSKDEMINISSCEFPQFKSFMGDKYGADVFD